MSNEKQNDSFHWKNKLEELDSLPGEIFADKNAAWEKLHQRLAQKPRRNKAVWYWAAALLLVICIPWIITNKKENVLVKNGRPQKQTKKIPFSHLSNISKETIAVIPFSSKEQVIHNEKKTAAPIRSYHRLKTNQHVIAIAATKMKPGITINTIPPNSTLVTIAGIPEKKNIRIVHINELEPVPEQTASALSYRRNKFSIKWRNDNTLPAHVPPEQGYAGISTIKIPLKN